MIDPARRHGCRGRWSVLMVILIAALLSTQETTAKEEDIDLTELSIEELLDLEVTSVSKKSEKWNESAAAIHVITAEDIRRSDATTLAEALRFVPGLAVAQIDASKWAVSSRGFNGQFANKLLVMIDGRTVYTPLFAGVFWEVQDTLLEDIERIEVIRGPGATLWGANAVNGVINIITRDARETQGALLSLAGGSEERGSLAFRHGGRLGGDGHYRVFAKRFDRDGTVLPDGSDADDDWRGERAGFRIDREKDRFHLTISGEIYDHEIGQGGSIPSFSPPFQRPIERPIEGRGGHLLAHLERTVAEGRDWSLKLYYDRTEYRSASLDDQRDTVDLDFQERRRVAARHEIVWGLGYRRIKDREMSTVFASFSDERHQDDLASAFLQDEIRFADGRARLILGSKLEHNDYTGLEIQPGVRALFELPSGDILWGSVTRAVRTPSRGENDVRLNLTVFPLPEVGLAQLSAFGNRELDSESLMAYELGLRLQPSPMIAVDLTVFWNDYRDLLTLVPGAPFFETAPVPHLVLPLEARNGQDGETAGLEVSLLWDPGKSWHLAAGYTFLELDLEDIPPETVPFLAPGDNPQHQAFLRIGIEPTARTEADLMLEAVDRLPSSAIESRFNLDARWAFHPRPGLELSLLGRNLLDDEEPEFSTTQIGTTIRHTIERSVEARLTWKF